MAYNSVHGRYFAGKQVKCEFVSLTRWKVAICGEYMKSRLKTCSRGTACNFLHCFSNPGGDYEWADCDKPAPRDWVKKMTALFGYPDDSWHDKQIEQPSPKDQQNSSRIFTSDRDSYHYKRRRSMETNQHKGSSGRSHDEENHVRKSRRHEREKDDKSYEDEAEYKNNHHRNIIADNTDSDGDWLDRDAHRIYHDSSRNSSRHNRKESKSRDYYGRSRTRTHGSSSDEDLHTERRRVYTKKRSRRRKNYSESSNDDGESDGAKREKQIEMRQSSSEPSEAELQRHKERATNSSRNHRRSRRHDGDEGVYEVDHRQSENEPFAKEQKRCNRKSTMDKNVERRSLHLYDRSRSLDSGCHSDKNDDMSDRWEPDSSSNEHDKHSSKVNVKDYQISDDIIDTRKPKDRRSSSRKRLSGSLEEEFDNSEDISKSSHRENHQSDDRDHRTREKRKRI